MKKKIVISLSVLFLCLLGYFLYNGANYRNYGKVLPPKFPKDIPVIEGQITSSKKTLFDDGKGFVVDIDTKEGFHNVIDFYKSKLPDIDIKLIKSTEENMATGEAYIGKNLVILEIVDKKNSTHVTLAVHLNQKKEF